MEYTTLGETGLQVSRIGLGCVSFGTGAEWMLDEEASAEIIHEAIDLGVNFFDTGNNYSMGESERILGSALAGHRERSVVATKVYFPMDAENPNSGGLSRKAIEQELSNSLERLGMDTVDLYQIHRWDDKTPIETTLRALDDAVRRGQVRYLGASTMWAYQLATALRTSDRSGLERFATMQNHYNLVYREEEREMLPLCRQAGIGVIPWSPLAKGYLTRPHESFETTTRAATDEFIAQTRYREGGGHEVNARVEELAEENGVSMAQIAIAWHLHNRYTTAPIVGVSSIEHLHEAVEAVDVRLAPSDVEYLEEPYEPLAVSGELEDPHSAEG